MTISNQDDVIDSRDVIERIEELEDLMPSDASEILPGSADEVQEIREELTSLKALAEQCEGYAEDWQYGEALIRDSYFEEYMDDMIADCYSIPEELPSFMSIKLDYEALQQDYTMVSFDGVDYWIR